MLGNPQPTLLSLPPWLVSAWGGRKETKCKSQEDGGDLRTVERNRNTRRGETRTRKRNQTKGEWERGKEEGLMGRGKLKEREKRCGGGNTARGEKKKSTEERGTGEMKFFLRPHEPPTGEYVTLFCQGIFK